MFGSEQGTYFKMPEALRESEKSQAYLRLLDGDLKRLLELSRQSHLEVIAQRRTPTTEATQNVFMPGDLVLVQQDVDKALPSKLSLPFTGPHEVLRQKGNDVQCLHLATHQVTEYPVTRVKIFHGTLEEAKRSAEEDYDQSQVRAITAWKGNPLVKTTMSFRVEFADGDVIWLLYSQDLDETEAFGKYTASLPMQEHLSYGPTRAKELLAELRRAAIQGYAVGEILYVDIRCYSTAWYDEELTFLEDRYDKTYVVQYEVTGVTPRVLKAYCPNYDEVREATTGTTKLDAYWCYTYGRTAELGEGMILVTPEMCLRNPALISPDVGTRERVLRHHFPEHYRASVEKKKGRGKKTDVAGAQDSTAKASEEEGESPQEEEESYKGGDPC